MGTISVTRLQIMWGKIPLWSLPPNQQKKIPFDRILTIYTFGFRPMCLFHLWENNQLFFLTPKGTDLSLFKMLHKLDPGMWVISAGTDLPSWCQTRGEHLMSSNSWILVSELQFSALIVSDDFNLRWSEYFQVDKH